jgi:hypothetical protein
MKSPPDKTHLVQPIDDNVGRTFRDLACDKLEDDIGDLPEERVRSLTSADKRNLMVRAVQVAFTKWNDPNEKYIGIGQRAAMRTGLAMRIDDNCDGVRPVRFPEDYPGTIPAASGAPTRPYYIQGEVADPVRLNAVTATISTSLGQMDMHVHGLVDDVAVDVAATANATTVSLRPQAVVPDQRVLHMMEENGAFDGWSDEEERVYVNEEVDAESSSSEDEEEIYSRRRTKRIRWCLFGCDCERTRGRKCYCELRSLSGCGDKCGCDPRKCRARLENDSEED